MFNIENLQCYWRFSWHFSNSIVILHAMIQPYEKKEHFSLIQRDLSLPDRLLNGQILNIENLSREAHVKRTTVDNWLMVLEDTLIAYRLPAWRPQIKVREIAHPKFYWFDSGVARATAGLLGEPIDSHWLGFALEAHILHEIKSYIDSHSLYNDIFYYRSGSEVEIDLVIQLRKKHILPNQKSSA